ncbi:MAG: hypothetical protein JEZ05_08850 [Tenericutes bacterium]|nr:hypothetical protein [Mycoplasmatota bacterium]
MKNRNYDKEFIKFAKNFLDPLKSNDEKEKSLEDSIFKIYNSYENSYAKAVENLLISSQSKQLKPSIMLLIYTFLELWIKRLLWGYGEGGNSFKGLELDNHNLRKILEDNSNYEYLTEITNVLTKEQLDKLIANIKMFDSISINNTSIAFRYPIDRKNNKSLIRDEIFSNTSIKDLNEIWTFIKKIYLSSLINSAMDDLYTLFIQSKKLYSDDLL